MRTLHGLAVLLCLFLLSLARPARAQVDVKEVYADVKSIVEDLIKYQVGHDVGKRIKKDFPGLARYFRGTLARLDSAHWGALRPSIQRDLTSLAVDFVFFSLHAEAANGINDESLEAFFDCLRDTEELGDTCQVFKGTAGRTLFEAKCEAGADREDNRVRLACDVARIFQASLQGRAESARGHLIDLVSDAYVVALVRRHYLPKATNAQYTSQYAESRARFRRWFNDPETFQREHAKLIEMIGSSSESSLKEICSWPAAAPNQLEFVRSMAPVCTALNHDKAGKLAVLTVGSGTPKRPEVTLLLQDLASVDFAAAPADTLLALITRAGTRHCETEEPSIESLFSCENKRLTGLRATNKLLVTAGGQEVAVNVDAAGKLSSASWNSSVLIQDLATLKAKFPLNLAEVQNQVWDIACPQCGALPKALAETGDAYEQFRRLYELVGQIAEQYSSTVKAESGDKFLNIVSLISLAVRTADQVCEERVNCSQTRTPPVKSATATEAPPGTLAPAAQPAPPSEQPDTEDPLCRLWTMTRGGQSEIVVDLLAAIADLDVRMLATSLLGAAFPDGRRDVYQKFFVNFAAYLVDRTDDPNERIVTREAFRDSAKELLISLKKSGVPPGGQFRFSFAPSLGMRVSICDGYLSELGAHDIRYTVSADWPDIRFAATDGFGFRVSALDFIAPAGEIALRKSLERYEHSGAFLLDVVRPRIGVWAAIPDLTRNVVLTGSVGTRLISATEVKTADPAYGRYDFIGDGDRPASSYVEFSGAVEYVF